ncbi:MULTISPECIES: hypothetical protein [unclassified Pannonibacter]|uniref:hypothetical protein n=1 Tax=unclassified Pannonibacter TaxID=2627228 RepID=UPI00164539A5|nr:MULTISPECIES: hypothetical protein [unclassified Pannonibacter]
MKLSANEAAKRTGKSVPTITRAIKTGRISAEKNDAGGYLIDPAELFRVFPAVTRNRGASPKTLDFETPDASPVTPLETLLLQEKVNSLEAALANATAERDEWRDQAKRLAMALPAPGAEPQQKQPQSFWARLTGRR